MNTLSKDTRPNFQSNPNSGLSTLNLQFNWFAVRVTYGRELALKAILDKENIESFIPMRHEYITRDGRRMRKLVPAVHNLVFIHSTRKKIDELKEQFSVKVPIRYIMNRATNQPVLIPEEQMCSFILVSGNYDEAILYLEPTELALTKGQKVRIIDGIFKGAIGEFVRIRHDRRVVVNIEGVMAVATTFIHPSLIEPLESL